MRSSEGHLRYLQAQPISNDERNILQGFIEQRNAIKPTSIRTKGKQAYEGIWVRNILHQHRSSLDKCTVKDLLKVAGEAGKRYTKNSRQTKIVTLKAIAQYIHRFHHKIENLDLLMDDVKAGSAAKNRKVTLSVEEWNTLRVMPMSAKARAELYMMYDGYHRPGELAVLNWSDLRQDGGEIQYDILFKTEKIRTIVMRPAAIEVLEQWRKESGALLTDTTPIFPAPDGGKYQTITHLTKLFRRLKAKSGIAALMPSILRNSGMQHDLEAGLPVSYVCLRAWGEPYNELINLYTRPDSGKIQRDQHDKAGTPSTTGLGTTRGYTTQDDRLGKLEMEIEAMKRRHDLLLEAAEVKIKQS